MKTLLILLPLTTALIGVLTAILNLKMSLNKSPKSKTMNDNTLALIAIVIVCALVIAAICYIVKK